jgi:hypothetical protein
VAISSKVKTPSDDHPTPGTSRADNVSETPKQPGVKRGVGRPKRQGECYVGHAMTPENTYVNPAGVETCRECNRSLWRSYYHRKQLKDYYRDKRQSVRKSK